MKVYLLSVFIGLSGSVKGIRFPPEADPLSAERTSVKSSVKGLPYVALAK